MKIKKCKKGKLVAFSVIVAASKGDVETVNQVLQHYEGYIISLSTRTLYDEFGTRIFVRMKISAGDCR